MIAQQKTLNYLFHELLPHEGFEKTHDFIRDRSRAVRNDFTMQHDAGPLAMECHERCARFHIMALHLARKLPVYNEELEIQQLQNSKAPPFVAETLLTVPHTQRSQV